jgi:hypothetical protein
MASAGRAVPMGRSVIRIPDRFLAARRPLSSRKIAMRAEDHDLGLRPGSRRR